MFFIYFLTQICSTDARNIFLVYIEHIVPFISKRKFNLWIISKYCQWFQRLIIHVVITKSLTEICLGLLLIPHTYPIKHVLLQCIITSDLIWIIIRCIWKCPYIYIQKKNYLLYFYWFWNPIIYTALDFIFNSEWIKKLKFNILYQNILKSKIICFDIISKTYWKVKFIHWIIELKLLLWAPRLITNWVISI